MAKLLLCVVIVAVVMAFLLNVLLSQPNNQESGIIGPQTTNQKPEINIDIPPSTTHSCRRKNGSSVELSFTTLSGHSRLVSAVAISPDGHILASGSYEEVKLWDLRSIDYSVKENEQHTRLKGVSEGDVASIGSLAVNHNGTIHVVGGGWGKGKIPIWRLSEEKLSKNSEEKALKLLSGHGNDIRSVAISPDNQILASGSYEEIKIWDLSNYQNKKTIKDELKGSNYVTSLAIDHSKTGGNILVSGSTDGTIRTLNLNESLQRLTLFSEKISSPVRSLAIKNTPNDTLIVSGYENGKIQKRNLLSPEVQSTQISPSIPIHSLTISPDGELLAVATGKGEIKVWNLSNLNSDQPILTCASFPDYVNDELLALKILQNKQLLVIGYGFKVIKLWLISL